MNPVILADNRFLDATPTATDTASGYSVLNIRDLQTFTSWKAASAGTKYLYAPCVDVLSADALAMISHNLGTASASVSVESSATGAWAGEQSERLAPFTPTDDKAFLKLFTSASDGYWRVKLVTGSVAPQVSVCLLGRRITFPYPPVSPYTPARERVEAESKRSKTGQLLGSVIRFKPFEISPEWRDISRTWIDTYIAPFWLDYYSNLNPFFWAWDLDTYPTHVRFAKAPDDVSYDPSVSVLSLYDRLVLPMEGVLE